MKKIIILSALFLVCKVYSQQVQWASKLIKYSTDLGGKQYGVKRILGKPDAFPQGGSCPNAWVPKNALDGYEFVEVGFEKPQTVKQIAIFENLNAGCVTRVLVDTGNGKYTDVWGRKKDWKTPTYRATLTGDRNYYFGRKRRKIQKAPEVNFNPGIENIILDSPVSNVVAVRVEFSFALVPGQKQIDAIGISDSDKPLDASISVNPLFEELQPTSTVDLGNVVPGSIAISPDGNKMYVTNINSDKDEIMSFTKNASGNWGNMQNESSLSTNDYYNFFAKITPTYALKGGKTYTRGTTQTGFEIYTYQNGNIQFDKDVNVVAYNNYDNTADASLTKDKSVLIMAIETDFTQGGSDLYFSKIKEDGTYGILQSMGKVVNSAGDEFMCHLLSDDKTLLFVSNGYSGFGDNDIYLTQRLDDTWKNWSEPINLGSKINSNDYDGNPYYDETTEKLYYTSSVNGELKVKNISIPKKLLMK
ncbi:MAG TPA: hypothetical protein PLP39_01930 [Flavobacterium lutivivi]|nr:hypothetical protein [Flavobacterium lutivivi]